MFGKERVSIVFDKATLKKNKDGAKLATIRFAVRLDAEVVLACPAEIRAAYEAVDTRENKITLVELEKEIVGVNCEFYTLPDSKNLNASFQSVNLKKFSVEREEGDTPNLFFSIELPIEEDKKIRYWIVDNVFSQLWAKFEAAQMVLTPTIATEVKEQRLN